MSPDERNELATSALPVAYGIADTASSGMGSELIEAARDAATEAVCRAINEYDPGSGDWLSFVRSFVYRQVRRDLRRAVIKARKRPRLGALDGEQEPIASDRPAAGGIPMDVAIRELPELLRNTVRLVYIDGYSHRDAAALLGIAPATLRKRLRQAAGILRGKGDPKPADGGD